MKKVGEITRPFRYGLNQIPYDFTVEIRNRFKGRDIVQEAGIKTIPMKKEMQKSKMAVWGGLTNSCEKKRSKSKGKKERDKHLNAEFQSIARRDKKAFFSDQ